MNKRMLRSLNICLIIVAAIFVTGCTTPKNISYFQDVTDGMMIETVARRDIRLQPDDKLSIVVNSKDPELASLFNLGIYSNRIGQASSGTGGAERNYSLPVNDGMSTYTVNAAGDIDFPVLGKLHVEGMTRQELVGFIKGELIGRNLIKDPIVTVEFINTGISVLGDVNRPGRFDINRDNLTIVDAIALAGDLTILGERENIMVLREENGKTQAYRINLTDAKSMMASPAYYLKQGDVIYVEPNNMKKRSTTVNGNNVLNASFWISIVSLLSTVSILIFK